MFFTTAKCTAYAAEFWGAMGLDCVEIHSRKSQAQRDRASKVFHDSTNVILFTSDVTARGLDYPDVDFIIQVTASVVPRPHAPPPGPGAPCTTLRTSKQQQRRRRPGLMRGLHN